MSKSSESAHAHTLTRRSLLKGTAAGGVAAVGLGAGGVEEVSMVGDAEAIGCGGLCIGAAAVGGAAVVGWTLREFEVIGSDGPAQGLTSSALLNEAYTTVDTRKSNNQSTFVDNRNLLSGVENAAYSEGKVAAIEALNQELSKSEVTSAATSAANSYEETVLRNLLKSWNESVREHQAIMTRLSEHSNTVQSDLLTIGEMGSNLDSRTRFQEFFAPATQTYTFSNGTTLDVERVGLHVVDDGTKNGTYMYWDPTGYTSEPDADNETYTHNRPQNLLVGVSYDGNRTDYLAEEWLNLFSDAEAKFTTVRDNLVLWVDELYSKVQAGEISTSELLSSTELANLTADGEETNQAIADLIALNVPVNLDREAEVRIPSSGTTLYGSLGVSAEKTLSAGTTIDPTADSASYYLTYDASEAHGTWSAVNESVDGGTVTFTEEPHPSVLWTISTGAQETAEVASSDFTDNGDGTWSVDISGQVETAITTVAEVNFYSASETTQMETILLDEPFEIVTFTDSNGEDVSSADYTKPSAPQDDTNYITQEEWEQREQKYTELIDKYENSTGGGGGLPSFGDFSPTQMVVGGVVVLGSIFGIGQLSS
jgi:hypothetical protein